MKRLWRLSATAGTTDHSRIAPAVVCLALTFFIAPDLMAEELAPQQIDAEVKSEDQDSEGNWLSDQFDWLLRQRDAVSRNIYSTAVSLDRFIARESFDETVENGSYLRIRFNQRYLEGGTQDYEARVKLKIDLPNTKRKTRLFFDSDPDDLDSISDKRRSLSDNSENRRQQREDSQAGISFDTSRNDRLRSDFDIGAKLRIPLDPFVRYQLRYSDDLGKIWKGRFKQQFSYFSSESWATDTELDIYRPFGEDKVLLFNTELQFIDRDNNWESFQGISLQHRLDDRNALEYSTGVIGNSRPRTEVGEYWVNVSWRRRLHEDWLYLTVTPEFNFERENDFSGEFSVRLQLEIFFSRDDN